MRGVAITQQLARLPQSDLDACRTSADRLDEVCSFTALPEDDHLDLDWAPSWLADAANATGLAELAHAVELATAGRGEVNPDYRDHPDTIFEHPVAALTADEVVAVAADLAKLAPDGFPAEADVAGLWAVAPEAYRPEDPQAYLRQHIAALVSFYRGAAERGLAVVMWWD
jgi:hypothetical protein